MALTLFQTFYHHPLFTSGDFQEIGSLHKKMILPKNEFLKPYRSPYILILTKKKYGAFSGIPKPTSNGLVCLPMAAIIKASSKKAGK